MPSREAINNNPWVRIPPLPEMIRLHEAIVAPLQPAPVIALALNTFRNADRTLESGQYAVWVQWDTKAGGGGWIEPKVFVEDVEAFDLPAVGWRKAA